MKIQRIPKYPFPNNENINRMQTAVDETRGVFRFRFKRNSCVRSEKEKSRFRVSKELILTLF